MPDDSARKMVDAAVEKNAVDFKSSMEDSMNERIATQLRDRKMEIANKMFNEEDAKDMQLKNVGRKKKHWVGVGGGTITCQTIRHNDVR